MHLGKTDDWLLYIFFKSLYWSLNYKTRFNIQCMITLMSVEICYTKARIVYTWYKFTSWKTKQNPILGPIIFKIWLTSTFVTLLLCNCSESSWHFFCKVLISSSFSESTLVWSMESRVRWRPKASLVWWGEFVWSRDLWQGNKNSVKIRFVEIMHYDNSINILFECCHHRAAVSTPDKQIQLI